MHHKGRRVRTHFGRLRSHTCPGCVPGKRRLPQSVCLRSAIVQWGEDGAWEQGLKSQRSTEQEAPEAGVLLSPGTGVDSIQNLPPEVSCWESWKGPSYSRSSCVRRRTRGWLCGTRASAD